MSVEITVTDGTGTQGRFLPMGRVDLDACSFAYRADGGMTQGTLATSLTLAEAGRIAPGDRVEVRIGGVLFWRGYVSDPSLSRADLQTASFTLYGAWNYALRATAQQRYLKPGGVDASRFFADVVRGWVLPLFPSLVVQADTIGVLKDREDAWGRPVRDVLGELRDWCGADCVFGSDVVDAAFGDDPAASFGYGRDRLFLRKARDATAAGFVPDFAEFTPGLRGGAAGREIRSSEVVNALYFVGGPREFPNLFPSDMETPRAAGEGVGNLLQSPGFEDRAHWALFGGASYKSGGHTEGNAYAGATFVETDNAGEGFRQTRDQGDADWAGSITPGRTYQFGGHARQLQGAQATQGAVTLTWHDAGKAALAPAASLAVQPPSAGAWERYTQTAVAPAGAAGFTLEARQTTDPGDGLAWDEMEVLDLSTVYMDGVELLPFGDARVVGQNWVVEGRPYSQCGAYSHVFQVTAADADKRDVHLQPRGKARAQCLANQSLTFSVPLRLPPGAPASPKLQMEIEFYDGNGKSVAHPKQVVPAGSVTAAWSLPHMTAQAPSNAVYVCAWLTVRGGGTLECDAFCLRDSSTDVGGVPVYVPTGPLVARFRAADFPELSPAQRASEAVYGYREPNQAYASESVTLDADARKFALNLFRQKALPPERGPFEVFGPARPIVPGMVGRLSGPDGPLLAGQARRVQECDLRFSRGVPVLSLTMEDARPDAARFLLDLALRRKTQSSASSASGGGGSGGGANGGIPGVSGGAYRTTLEASETDPTLHDDYRGGPHVSDQEHTDLAGARADSAATKAEVVAARTRTATGALYPSLEARLDAQDGASAATGSPAWGLQGVDSSAGGNTAFNPGDISPTWQGFYNTPTGDLALSTGNGRLTPVAYEQRVVFYTRLKVAAAVTIQISVKADNACRVILNGAQIDGDNPGDTAVTHSLPLAAGWNTLVLCYQNGQGDTYELAVSGVGGGLATLVDRMAGYLPPAPNGSTTLAGDADVAIAALADNQVLTYEAASARWKNKAPVSGAAATTAEVVAARTNAAGTLSYTSLKGRIDAVEAAPAPKRKLTVSFAPTSATADTGPNLDQYRRLPDSATGWQAQTARLHVDTPNANPTTIQVYHSSPAANAPFGAGTALLSAPLSVSGAAVRDASTTGFTGAVPGGAFIAPAFTALAGSKITADVAFQEI